eukprot:m.19410 g.19410  ORF g.19410 m.19410 type:complete len:62 (-) comp8677_c0_seq2:171-356(-)
MSVSADRSIAARLCCMVDAGDWSLVVDEMYLLWMLYRLSECILFGCGLVAVDWYVIVSIRS